MKMKDVIRLDQLEKGLIHSFEVAIMIGALQQHVVNKSLDDMKLQVMSKNVLMEDMPKSVSIFIFDLHTCRFKICNSHNFNKILVLGSVDNDLINIASQAFIICNTDGQEGLTWDETKSCEVIFFQKLYNLWY